MSRYYYRVCILIAGVCVCPCVFFFFNDTATTEIYTLSLPDALPICRAPAGPGRGHRPGGRGRGLRVLCGFLARQLADRDRKSTRLNSSHLACGMRPLA